MDDKRKNLNKLLLSVREALLRDWDPIGIQDEPCAHGEYDSYAPQICTLLINNANVEKISDHLLRVETEFIGLPGNISKAKLAAEKLIELCER